MELNVDDMLKALGKELDMLEGQFPIMQYPGGRNQEHLPSRPRQQDRPSMTSALFAGKESSRKFNFCSEDYPSDRCKRIKSPDERKNILLKTGRCFKLF